MNRTEWKEFCNGKYIILDGATGSNLMNAGMPIGVCPEEWILEHPEALINLQKEYVAAGSNIVYAPTFTANRVKLKEYGLHEKQEEIIHGLVQLSKQAVNGQAIIAGDISMTGKQLAPIGDMSLEELIDIYKEQITYMADAGVDLLIIETMMSLAETRAAVIAAKEVSELPILVTMTFEENGKTLFGTDAQTAAIVLESLGVDGLGVNCSTGPADMAKIIKKMAEVVSVPLIAKPNAGLPIASEDGKTVYDMSPETFAEEVQELITSGAVILGGCCGTAPSYIEKLRDSITGKVPAQSAKAAEDTEVIRLTDERRAFEVSKSELPIAIGEIHASCNEELREELLDDSLEILADLVMDLEDEVARVIDINFDMEGISVKDMMLRAIEELQMVCNLPLSFSSKDPQVIEAVLRNYPGRGMVNSGFAAENKEQFIAICEKYGAVYL